MGGGMENDGKEHSIHIHTDLTKGKGFSGAGVRRFYINFNAQQDIILVFSCFFLLLERISSSFFCALILIFVFFLFYSVDIKRMPFARLQKKNED